MKIRQSKDLGSEDIMTQIRKDNSTGLETKALHAGYGPIPMDMRLFRSFTPPIIQSAIYPFESVDQYTRFDPIYS